jgi:glutathione S-transferase
MILHDAHHLAPCYAVRLLAALVGADLTLVPLDVYPGQDHRSPAFLAINPLGTLPVLTCDGRVLTDWQEMLALIALRHDPAWFPGHDPALIGALGVARDLLASAGAARMIATFGAPGDIGQARAAAEPLLDAIEQRRWHDERAGHRWLIPGPAPTIADIAAFVSIAPCEDAGISLRDRPALRRWCDAVRFLPGFVAMSGVFPPMANTGKAIRTNRRTT